MSAATCEIWLCIDQAGDYGTGRSAEAARENYEAEIGELSDVEGFRMVKATLSVPLPEVAELTGDVPAMGDARMALAVA